MLHIIATSNQSTLSQFMTLSQSSDSAVILLDIFPHNECFRFIQKLAHSKAKIFGVLENLQQKPTAEIHTISYDEFAQLCAQHPSIHTWY